MGGIADYEYSLPFVDLTKQSRKWGSFSAPYDGNCTTGADGWPAQSSFGNIWYTLSTPDAYQPSLAGNYTLFFEGSAVVVPPANVAVYDQVYNTADDTTTAVLVVPRTIQISISFTNASTRAAGPGLKSIKLLQPGFPLTQADDYAPAFLQLMSRFDVIRFMDWMRTNGCQDVNWSDRTQPDAYSYALHGPPWERVIELANLLDTDIHINVPAHASDDYVTQLALLLNATLAPDIAIHVEYSNEVWNWDFEQATYNLQMANASVYAGDLYHFNYTGSNMYGWAVFRHVYMVKHIGDLFAAVFGRENVGKDARVRPVYAWQLVIGHEAGLRYLSDIWGPPSSILHAIAGAPYLYGRCFLNASVTVDDVIAAWTSAVCNMTAACTSGMSDTNVVAMVAQQASFYGINLMAYEGGPDTVQGVNNGTALQAKGNATVDARAEMVVRDFVAAFMGYGPHVRIVNYYRAGAGPVFVPFGIYDLLTNITTQDTPKMRGIDTARSVATPVSPGIPSIASSLLAFNASFFVGHTIPVQLNPFALPRTLPYMFYAPAATRVSITAHVSALAAPVALHIALGGPPASAAALNVTCPVSGGWSDLLPCNASAPFNVPAGTVVFRITNVGAETAFLGLLDVNVLTEA